MHAVYPNIEAERARMGISKGEMAEKLGVTTKTYYNWQKGINPVPSTVLIKLSDMSGAKIDFLLGRSNVRT